MKLQGLRGRKFRLFIWGLILSTIWSQAQTADWFEFSPVSPQAIASAPFSVTIRARSFSGAVATNYQGTIRLFSFASTAVLPVISEIDSAGETVEITNPGEAIVDLSDWELQVLTDYGGVSGAPTARLRLPLGTMLGAQGMMTWTGLVTPPGGFPQFVSSKRFNLPSAYRLTRLFNSVGQIVDEVYSRPSATAPTDALWRGAGLGSFPTNVTFQRVGDANHFRNVDWATSAPSLGALNAGLRVPWNFTGRWLPAVPATATFTNGVWTAYVTLSATAAGGTVLKADDGNGIVGTSALFYVVAPTMNLLAVTLGGANASESAPGASSLGFVILPSVLPTNLTVQLVSGDTNEFTLPSQAVVAANANWVQFYVTNRDDAVVDGLARVTLTASAPGFAPGTTTLLNEDDESGLLTVIVPGPLKEDSGFSSAPGIVFLPAPAQHDVQVLLSSEAPLEMPESVIIPAGKLSQTFWVRVGDDALANPYGRVVMVRAAMPGWPPAETAVSITDDEDAGFTVSMPGTVAEGSAGTGQIQVKTAHSHDTVFTITSNNSRLVVPAQVTLLAGALTVDFQLVVPQNEQVDAQAIPQVCVQTAGESSACKQLIAADDEVDIRWLAPAFVPQAVFSGVQFPFSAKLINVVGAVQRSNTTGQVDLLMSPAVAQLSGVTNPVFFTNGIWSNLVTVVGETLDARFAVSAAGLQTNSGQFDVLLGRDVPMALNDAVWHAGLGRFLVAEPPQTNPSLPARLTEIDPVTGQRGRSLSLPRAARRIALSYDGAVAWLASTQSTLQRVDIAGWLFDREVPLDLASTNTDPRDLVVLPGEREKVVVVANITNAGFRVLLFDHGIGMSNRAVLPGAVISLALVAGRNANEVFCQSFGKLSRFQVASNGVTLGYSTNVGSSSIEWPTLSWGAGWLIRGYGEVYDPDTLVRLASFPTQQSLAGVAVNEQNAALFVGYNRSLTAYNQTTRVAYGSHSLPDSAGTPLRFLRWGTRGLASFTSAGTNLTLFQTPLLTTNAPDLVVSAVAPTTVTLQTNQNLYTTFYWQISVTNHGTAPAQGVQLNLEGAEHFDLGSLAPGEGTTVAVARVTGSIGVFIGHAAVTSAIPDAAPGDNEALWVTRVTSPPLPSFREVVLGMTHLIAAPDGQRLYAAVAKSAGDDADGVAVVDPGNGNLEAFLAIGENPQRLAATHDGSRLFALLGTNRIAHWNLAGGYHEVLLTLTNEAVLDLAAVPGSPTSVVVATTTRVVVFDGAQPRPLAYTATMDRRHLGYASGQLWVAEPGQLLPFTVGPTGLTAGTPVAFSLFSDYYRFASDGRFLFFSGAVFDTVAKVKVNTSFLGDHFAPDAANDALFSPVGGCIRNHSLTTYTLRKEQCLPPTVGGYLQDPVRWGVDGLAFRSGQQLLIASAPLLPTNTVTDLSVSVGLSGSLAYVTNEWTITLTNRSDQAAHRVILTINWGDLRDLQVTGPLSSINFWSMTYDAGELAAHGSATFGLRGWAFPGNLSVSASVTASGSDVTPADNTATLTTLFQDIAIDLGIHSVSMPAQVAAGAEFSATFVFTNAGPNPAVTTMLQLVNNSAVEFLGVVGNAYPTNDYGPLLGTLNSGESRSVPLRFRAKGAGLLIISAYAEGSGYDPQYGNDRGGGWVYAAPALTNELVTEMSFPAAITAWDSSRQQVLAAFPNDFWTLFILNPLTLKPVGTIALPGLPEFIAPCNNGRHAWVSLAGGAAARVDLETLTVETQFRYDVSNGPVRAAAAPPGTTNLLLAIVDPDWLGNDQVVVFDNGVARPMTHSGLGWMGGGASLVFTPEGKLFVATSQKLRELKIVPSGLQYIANLDALGEYDRNRVTATSNRLHYLGGRTVNLSTQTASYPVGYVPYYCGDRETSLAYLSPQVTAAFTASLSCFDALTMTPIWKSLPIQLPYPVTSLGSILPLGTNGVLLFGEKLRLVKSQLLQPPAADLQVILTLPGSVSLPNLDFPIQVAVSNASAWTDHPLLSLELSPGLVFSSGPAIGQPVLQLDLGLFNGATNLSFLARATNSGSFTVSAAVTNSLPDPLPANNLQQADVTVVAPPLFYLDSVSVPEGAASGARLLTAWLSRPAPTNLNASFTVELVTAQASDFNALAGVFAFATGQQKATPFVVQGDAVPEMDETANFVFASSNLTLARPVATVTLVNDDWPMVTVTNLTINEGNLGTTSAIFRATLSATAPFPVEVLFRAQPGTATAEVDYLSRQGWLQFPSNQTLKTFSLPVVGDTDYELAETVSIALLDQRNAELATAQAVLTIRNDDLPPRPSITMIRLPNDQLQVRFNSIIGPTYRLQYRTNLLNDPWKQFPTTVTGDGGTAAFTFGPFTAPQTFFRVTGQ